MNHLTVSYLNKLRRDRARKRRLAVVLVCLSLVVAGSTVWALHMRGESLTQESSSCDEEACTVFCHSGTDAESVAVSYTARSSGHGCLSYLMNYQHTSDNYRAYLEYSREGFNESSTSGILRRSVLYVYAFAGETICLGSDVTVSQFNNNNEYTGTDSGSDIVLVTPQGQNISFDNVENGIGYIGTTAQEAAGANYSGSGNAGGYTPHEYKVQETGIYEIHFHSYDGGSTSYNTDGLPHLKRGATWPPGTSTSAENPTPVAVTSDAWYNNGATVGAFDVTVVGSDGSVQPGRTYAKYLALNIGKNSTTATKYIFSGDFYFATDSGYIYHTTFDLDPWGFIFFANNRGLVNTTTGYSAYHSYKTNSNTLALNTFGITFANPAEEDSNMDTTHMLFFEEPDDALTGILFAQAFAPEKIEDVEFVGSKEGNVTYVGNGGFFKFETEGIDSVNITIDFSEYNTAHEKGYQSVSLTANVVDGLNYVYWDGYDGAGVEVEQGYYDSNAFKVTVDVRVGEFHFPFLDVENCEDITIERINKIYEKNNGVVTDATANYATSSYTIYYNNSSKSGTSYNKAYNMSKSDLADENDFSKNGIDSSGGKYNVLLRHLKLCRQ